MTAEPLRLSFPELAERYNQLQGEALKLDFVVRDSGMQEEKIAELQAFRDILRAKKDAAVVVGDEWLANTLFLFQCMINALRSSLTLWLKIKAGRPEEAWGALVDAQEYTAVALRVPVQGAAAMNDYAQLLLRVEAVVFPGWPMFVSPGIIEEGSGDCSICGRAYDSCDDHVEGLVYAGRLCDRLNRKIKATDHAAFVPSPHDKRCIIRYMSTPDGRKRDYITWKVLDERFSSDDDTVEETNGRMIDVVMLNTKRLDVD